jgi:hypothetical protein
MWVKPQHRAEMPKRVPRQYMWTLGAKQAPPCLVRVDPSELVIANTDVVQLGGRWGIGKSRTLAHVLAQSAISISCRTG